MTDITLILPYYESPTMFEFHVRCFGQCSDLVREHLEIIFIDDVSPLRPLIPVDFGFNVRYFRVLKKANWNIPFCRNLGAFAASHNWLILTDIDHTFLNPVLEHLIEGSWQEDCVYWFSRSERGDTGKAIFPHMNTYFMSKPMYERCGGDDERTANIYAAQEPDFLERSKKAARAVIPISDRYPLRDWTYLIEDARVRMIARRTPENHYNYWQYFKLSRQTKGYKPLRMSFPYEEIARFNAGPHPASTTAAALTGH